jgi:hypothetical protein
VNSELEAKKKIIKLLGVKAPAVEHHKKIKNTTYKKILEEQTKRVNMLEMIQSKVSDMRPKDLKHAFDGEFNDIKAANWKKSILNIRRGIIRDSTYENMIKVNEVIENPIPSEPRATRVIVKRNYCVTKEKKQKIEKYNRLIGDYFAEKILKGEIKC